MKFSEAWLREWVDPDMDTGTLAHELTMAGLEVDGVDPVAPPFSDVVVGEVLNCERHPDADKLTVCTVAVGADEPLQIVCGAPNVHVGMKAPTALVGAMLPGGFEIKNAKLRGVESSGMLCSEKELGLGEGADGLMALDSTTPVGVEIRQWLDLDDAIIDLDLTPNRGDCFSVIGVAREVGAISGQALSYPDFAQVPAATEETFPVVVEEPTACPRFCGRVIRGIDTQATTPRWMKEKIRRAGLRPIHPIVDVTNFVMTELGQPLHSFDLASLQDGIIVRLAKKGEMLTLLDGREVKLEPDMLVIADHSGARALAGIMGGETSGVTGATADVFFEVAFFSPAAISGRPRRLGLHTDASLRFERGVDPVGQRRAIERATALLVDIAGGTPGPVIEVASDQDLPQRNPVSLRRERLSLVLGVSIPNEEVEGILGRLGMQVEADEKGWRVSPPSWRFDINIEEDLIEEVARIHGYDEIPESDGLGAIEFTPQTETRVAMSRAQDVLVDRGYREVVTYSFVDRSIQAMLEPDREAVVLSNPISSEMTDMRVSLWTGLLDVLAQNLSRQQSRIKIFEYGLKFYKQHNEIKQINVLSGLIAGERCPEQWADGKEDADFYDLKGDIEAVLKLTGQAQRFEFVADRHPALHPGQTARIRRDEQDLGWMGRLHPAAASRLNLSITPYLFEIEENLSFEACVPVFAPVSRYPFVRRDIAVVVDEEVTADRLAREIRAAAGELLKELRVFDVYRGPGVDSGRKSTALGLILQETSRTLTDGDADAVVRAVISRLERKLKARIRD